MSEAIYFQSFDTAEVDVVLQEMETFNDLVESLDSITPELKEELRAAPGGKFGSIRDFEGEFAGAKG
jgi:hypothetical protein